MVVVSFGAFLSGLLGWLYFLAWSVSFYPQAILNYRRKSVQGLSIDFLVYNAFGFACYALYNLTFYASPAIRREYEDRNEGKSNLVQLNDVFFAVHAFLIASFTLGQSFVYKRNTTQELSFVAKAFLFISGIGIAALSVGITFRAAMWIDLLYFLSYIKLFISLVKYCPQVYVNYKAQSTVGWSIHNVLLDLTGGVLSMSQLVLDAARLDNWGGIAGNPVKLGLGLVSIAFDLVFIVQHYVLYRRSADFQRLSFPETDGGLGRRFQR
ncbi:PQ loop repeat-domain-containing protein [Dimargaris cristalligena]|uniref:PQ loop repeat-domain-containing protein n=1 Tax=Dimargaris cristalligena TaxID=215637 RepID=A0A4P9ZUZ5_9FUNG|nr:PQ loop repeat-domain-containing protein [Dimargaris cristalligena]|eukprot:RKP37404.1 PQ loop repeat-domain-containing protein [Dimargaris cristalligena]